MAMSLYRSVPRNSQCFGDLFNASFFGGAGGQISFTSCWNISRIFTFHGTFPNHFFNHSHLRTNYFRSSGLKVLLTSVKLIPNLVSSLISSAGNQNKQQKTSNSEKVLARKGLQKNYSTSKCRLVPTICLILGDICYMYDALLDYGG